MKMNIEMKGRCSESSSGDSGMIMEESVVIGDSSLESKISISASSNEDVGCSNDSVKSDSLKNIQEPQEFTKPDQPGSKNSPVSTHSNNISIVSIDEDADSSVIDSDSDFEDMPRNGEFIIQKLGQHVNDSDKNGIIIVSQNQLNQPGSNSGSAVAPKPQIGSIAVQNSTDITFGDKTFYQGPVTIKQFLLDNNKWKLKDSNGNVNPAFDGTSSENKNKGHKDDNNSLSSVHKKFKFNRKAIIITGSSLLLTILVLTIIFTTLLQSKSLKYKLGDGDDSRKNIPINSTIGNDNIGGGKVLRIISRSEWVAQPASKPLDDLQLPATKIIIAHTATEHCSTQASCTFHVRYMQTFHIESRNWYDISYNFLVGGDGAVYEGRGWDKEGAHTKGFNKRSICIAFIGTFNNEVPPEKQINAAKLLLEEGLRLNKISPNYKLFGHRQLIPSESPGEALYNLIRTWPHWSDEVDV